MQSLERGKVDMSLVIQRDGQPVHFPKNRDAFRFDEEVAEIFENMAQRSIPMYAEAHRMHAHMFADEFVNVHEPLTLFDIGASTGRWYRTLRKMLRVESLDDLPHLSCHAFDNSHPMLKKLSSEFPEVQAHFIDLERPIQFAFRADFVTMFYVLQFIRPEKKQAALQWVYDHMKPDSVLVLGQKERFDNDLETLFQSEYIRFRLDNGYTKEEIEAKTAALKNSMWCSTEQELRNMLRNVGFHHSFETSRWLNFSTVVAYK